MRKETHGQLMKVIVVSVLLYFVTPLHADIPWLHVDGNKIKDPEGNIVVLRGISLIDLGFLEGWQGGAINMIDRITNKNDSQGNSPGWYPKVLRIPIHPPDSVDNWPYRWDPGNDRFYNSLLRPVVDYCAEKDLYVILDWHYIADTWDKVTQTSEFWEYMAPRFANDSHVLFELFNEPINHVGSDTSNWRSVRTDMQVWVDIVRTYAPHNLILVGGPTWSQAIGPVANYRVSGNNIVIISHIYPSHWRNPSWYRNHIRTCAAVYPILMTEWGFSQSNHPDPDDLLHGTISDYGQPLMDFIEGLQIGNTAWVASHNWGPPMFYDDWTLRCGEGEMGCFVKDVLYEKRNDDQPHGAVQPRDDLGTPSTEGFETDDFSSFPWRRSGDASWNTTRQQSHSGGYCAKSGSIDHDESTTLEVTLDCVSGDISFYCKVSSESAFDYLKFYIDGEERDKWSGDQDWTQVSFPVNGGTRTFEWTYAKDGSVSDGDDAAWIDDIVFPLKTSDGGGPLPLTAAVEITTWQDNKRGACSFTFDDNQRTHLSHFIPKFADLGFVGTIFLITNDGALGIVYDSYSQYTALVDSGWEIGSHTVSHPHLTALGNSSLRNELADSRATLEALFDLPPGLTLAYPYSDSDARIRNIAAEYYIAARGGWARTIASDMSGWSLEGYSQFHLPSYGWTASEHDLGAMNGATDGAISRGEWIVEMIHGTEGDGWEPPDWESVYEPHFEYVKNREEEIWVDTFGNVYRYIAERRACSVSVQSLSEGTAVVLTNDSILPPTPVPLTIKMDIPDHWPGVTVTNNDNVLPGRLITENGNKYYLVNTRPINAPKELYVYGTTSPPIGPEPPDPEPTPDPDTPEGFDLYLDDIGPGILDSSWSDGGILDYYSENNPVSGNCCIHWTGVGQYSAISLRFLRVKDLSALVDASFAVDLWVRCSSPAARIDLRFVDTKTQESGDHPWRMRHEIDRNVAVWNGEWNHLQIPLNAFSEGGSWDDGWFGPIGAYDWTATQCFEIVAEYGDLKGIHFYFDDIRVVDPDTFGRP
jgi:peptidoglycan/xylan/chitin deacetylase (PgdA/CDA1 family)